MEKFLFPLENTSEIYPFSFNKNRNYIFRITAVLTETVDPAFLTQAVLDLQRRFPLFYSHIHLRFTRHYLKPFNGNFDIEKTIKKDKTLLENIDVKDKSCPLFRVLYIKNNLSVEFLNILSDASGALVYLKTLLARYYELQGEKSTGEFGILNVDEKASETENEDMFKKISVSEFDRLKGESEAYRFFEDNIYTNLKFEKRTFSSKKIKALASSYNVSVTEYILAAYARALLIVKKREDDTKSKNLPVRISLPINLRPVFHLNSLRNFSTFTNIEFKDNSSFDELLITCREGVAKGLEEKNLVNKISRLVALGRLPMDKIPFTRLKNFLSKNIYPFQNEISFSTIFSNLGSQEFTETISRHLIRLEYAIGKTFINKFNLSAASVGDFFTITLSSVAKNKSLEREFFNFLTEEFKKI